MQVTCGECQRSLNIPDEKVPEGRAFNVTCPGCKNKIKVEDHLKPAEAETPIAEEGLPIMSDGDGLDSSLLTDQSVDTTMMFTDDEFDEDEEIEFYDENDKIALVLDPENYQTWESVLTGLEFKLQKAKSPEHTVYKLKFNEYAVLVFNAEYGEYKLNENPLYEHLMNIDMSSRRKTFVVLIGESFHTGDYMEAFAHSVNMVFNPKDMEQLEMLLKKFLKENENFYKIYKDTMHSVGKA